MKWKLDVGFVTFVKDITGFVQSCSRRPWVLLLRCCRGVGEAKLTWGGEGGRRGGQAGKQKFADGKDAGNLLRCVPSPLRFYLFYALSYRRGSCYSPIPRSCCDINGGSKVIRESFVCRSFYLVTIGTAKRDHSAAVLLYYQDR